MAGTEGVRSIRGKVVAKDDTEVVDLDLDADDARLREAVGEPTTVRLDGVVVHIDHAAEWSNTAMRAATNGDWDTWAAEVIGDEKELKVFLDADLVNYQLEAIFTECGKAAQVELGKSRNSSHSSRNRRRR
jgi:hypothetical protein